jgi:phosphatidylglycerophosphatase A
LRLIKEKQIVDDTAKVDPFSIVFSSFFFIGYIKKASGTFGSLAAMMFFFIDGFNQPLILLICSLLAFFIGIFTSTNMTKRYGDDPSVVVIDEVAGMWLTVFIAQILTGEKFGILFLTISFFVFRIFDIVKIPPAIYFDRMKNGFGIMTDDIISAVYSGIFVYIIFLIINIF